MSANLDEPVTLTRGALHGLLRVMLAAGGMRSIAMIGEHPEIDLSAVYALAALHTGPGGDVLREALAEVEAQHRRARPSPPDEDLNQIPR